MRWRLAVLLILAAGVNSAPAKSKPRNWQSGEVIQIKGPRQGRQPGWGTIGPEVIRGEPGSQRAIMRESTTTGTRWMIEIALPGADYVVSLAPPPRKSSLMNLGTGSRVQCAVEAKSVYLKDDKGKVYRARIEKRSKAH